MEKEKPGYYSIITAEVRYDNNLTDSEKLLFSELTALVNKKGFCWASNNYFAELYDVTKKTISRRLKHLEDNGYIRRELIRNENKEVVKRKIYAVKSIGYTHNSVESMNRDVKESTTRTNNTSINNKPSDKSDTAGDQFSISKKDSGRYNYPEEYEKLYEIYPDNKGTKKAGWRKWAATRRKGISQNDLITAAENYKSVCSAENTQKKYVKHLSTFVGPDEHWREYLEIDEKELAKSKTNAQKEVADF